MQKFEALWADGERNFPRDRESYDADDTVMEILRGTKYSVEDVLALIGVYPGLSEQQKLFFRSAARHGSMKIVTDEVRHFLATILDLLKHSPVTQMNELVEMIRRMDVAVTRSEKIQKGDTSKRFRLDTKRLKAEIDGVVYDLSAPEEPLTPLFPDEEEVQKMKAQASYGDDTVNIVAEDEVVETEDDPGMKTRLLRFLGRK